MAGRAEAGHLTDVRARRQPRRHHARRRPDALAVVARALRVGRARRRRRARDGGALRLVRPPSVRRRRAASSSGSRGSPDDGSTTRSRRSTTRGAAPSPRTSASTSTRHSRPAGPSSSSRSARAVSRFRSPGPASTSSVSTPRRGCSPSHARPPRRPESPTVSTSASAICATRRCTERVPLVICPFRSLLHMETEDEKLRALRAARAPARAPTAASSSTSSPRAARTSRRRTAAGSSASRGSSSVPTGTRARGRSRSPSARTDRVTVVRPALALGAGVAAPARRGGVRRRGRLRLVRPTPVRRRGGHDLRRARAVESHEP